MAGGGHVAVEEARKLSIVSQQDSKEMDKIGSNYESKETTKTEEDIAANLTLRCRETGGDTMPVVSEEPRLGAPSLSKGWVKLSEKIYMCNTEPIKKGANVYKGKQKFAGEWRDVAIKLIPYDKKNLEEVKLHLKLEDHPNIIRLYDADEIQGVTVQIYIAMELCPQTLRDFIGENHQAPFDFDRRYSYAKQIVSGVAFIHKNNILHRDIKLENILLSPSKDYIRVADFGLSKELVEGYSVASNSIQGLGTEGYRAPELLFKSPEASFRSDSFAIGIVLALLFSNGQHPFGPDPNRWRTNIIDDNIRADLSSLFHFDKKNSPKRDQLLDLISRAIDSNPKDRPTPEEMLKHPFFSAVPESQREYRNTTITAGVNVAEGGHAIQHYYDSVFLINGRSRASVNSVATEVGL